MIMWGESDGFSFQYIIECIDLSMDNYNLEKVTKRDFYLGLKESERYHLCLCTKAVAGMFTVPASRSPLATVNFVNLSHKYMCF